MHKCSDFQDLQFFSRNSFHLPDQLGKRMNLQKMMDPPGISRIIFDHLLFYLGFQLPACRDRIFYILLQSLTLLCFCTLFLLSFHFFPPYCLPTVLVYLFHLIYFYLISFCFLSVLTSPIIYGCYRIRNFFILYALFIQYLCLIVFCRLFCIVFTYRLSFLFI